MNESRNNEPRRPDCVTEVRMGNTVLVVSGYFKTGRKEAKFTITRYTGRRPVWYDIHTESRGGCRKRRILC